MTSQRISRISLTLFVLGFVAACSSSSTLTIERALTESIPPGKSVALSVEPDIEDPNDGHRLAAQSLQSALFGRLVSDGVFERVVHAPEAADYSLDVKLLGARKVSEAAQFWLGVMAGPSNLKVKVDLRDQSTGQLLTTFDVMGQSAAHPHSSESDFGDAIREATGKVIEALK